LANGEQVWQTATDFNLQIQNIDLANFVKVLGRRLMKFLTKLCAPATFRLVHKGW